MHVVHYDFYDHLAWEKSQSSWTEKSQFPSFDWSRWPRIEHYYKQSKPSFTQSTRQNFVHH